MFVSLLVSVFALRVSPGRVCLTGRGGSEAVKHTRREILGSRFSR